MSEYARITTSRGREYVHRIRAERALGKPLPSGAEVHHLDGTNERRRTRQRALAVQAAAPKPATGA